MLKSVKHVLNLITVEPALMLHLVIYELLDFLNTNLFLQKACRFNQTNEPDLNTPCDDEDQGILFVSQVNSNYLWISTMLSTIYLMFATSWSDVAGRRRRPLMNLPIFGQICLGASGCLHSYFWHWIPMSAVASKYFFEISFGGSFLMCIATQIYICDISDKESRTMRLGLLWLVKLVTSPMGKGSAGFVLRGLGFFYSFLTCMILAVISLVFSLLFIKDISVPVERKARLRDVVNLFLVVDGFKVIFKKGVKYKRTIASLLLIVNTLGWTLTEAEHTVDYLFLKHKFHWDERMYSTLQLFRSVGVFFGTVFCSIVLSHLFKVHDGVIGALTSFFDTIAACGYAAAFESWHFYAVSLFDVFHGSSISVSISFLSKFFSDNEYGRLHSVIGVFGLFCPLGYILYNIVFQYTFDVFPSGFYVISIVMNLSILLMYFISYYLDKKAANEEPPKLEQADAVK